METTEFANQIRINTAEMLLERGFGHIGASMSIVETLAVLFNEKMDLTKDYFVLSKGHGGPAYYAALALKGYFDMSELKTLNQNKTILPSHPDRLKVPGAQVTTGSLGQGISQAVGIAKGLKIKEEEGKVYCIIGDGELNEGQVYEALIFASKEKLDNLVIFLDFNKKQLDGTIKQISATIDYKLFFDSLGLSTIRVDGKNCNEIKEGIDKNVSVIILDTIKGQGLPYFESMEYNHHVHFTPELKEILRNEIENLKNE